METTQSPLSQQSSPSRQRSRKRAASALLTIGALVLGGSIASTQSPGTPGSPLRGLTAVEFEEFRLGLDDFLEVEQAEDGLGPAFNGTSCAACHNVPAVGGMSTITEVRAARHNAQGEFEALDPTGETLFHLFSVPNHSCQPVVPPEANVIARRSPIPLFGAGLVEAIADETLIALEDPNDRNGDGVSGRAAFVTDMATGQRRVGRFGWKAQHATLLSFSGDAYRNEMGITNDLFPLEAAYGVTADRMRLCDPIPDPEDIPNPLTRRRGIDNFASFMRYLAPISRGAVDDQTRTGEVVFASTGCAACHVPVLTTAANANPLFHRQAVALYSDLLLHDVATGDGIKQAAAEANEIRTAALWGLRLRRPLLHDGSAATIGDAVTRHGHEAELARRGYERLSDADRAALLAFLRSL